MEQQTLWHDSFEDALRTVVDALGGPKKVADRLWPSKPLDEAHRQLLHCLDMERSHKLSLHEIKLLLQWGREANCHAGMVYLARECGYEPPTPTDPITEQEKLQREYIDSVAKQERIAKQLLAAGDRIKLARSA